MIHYKQGNIIAEDAEALVNTVNCVGVMGRGIALQFKKSFPANFKAYALACKREEVCPGRMFVYETGQFVNPRYIINFPTKRHWRAKSRLEDIDAGLESLVEEIRKRNVRSVAIPPLGCGLGGLDWAQVRPRIEAALRSLEQVRIVVFEPGNSRVDSRSSRCTAAPKMTPGRAALVGLMDRYVRGLLDPFVTLLELHKLMYFLQVAGEDLRLQYVKGPYGPYAEKLRHVLNRVEGHLVSGYADAGDAPNKRLQLVPGALEDACRFLSDRIETRERFDRVSDLVAGFETPFGLELLATVHWVVTKENAAVLRDVIAHTYRWNPRKRQFSKRQIALALDVLAHKQWIEQTAVAD